MSSVIWTLTLLTLASSGLCEIPAPVNLSISSHHFIHLLTWEPGPGSPVNLSYTVDVHSLRKAIWLNVSGCEEVVSPLVCNLTGALPDLTDQYYPRVQAKLGNQSSAPTIRKAFVPMEHTDLDPPSVSISVCRHSLCVGLSPPSSQLRQVYTSLSYYLTVSSGEDGAQYTLLTKGLVGEKIEYFEPCRKYCITAKIVTRKPASSQPQCIVVPYSTGLCEIPAPVNLSISSHNFIHLLTWEPGPGSPVNLSYTVDVHSLRKAIWLNVSGCEAVVSPLVCNLTGALPDLTDQYYPRVQAKLGNQSSAPTIRVAFIPMEHTDLDPPSVSISVCRHSLCVGLSPPSSQLRQVYTSLSYNLTVSSGEDGAQYTLLTKGLVGEKIKYFEPGRKYCITATIVNRKPASSQPQCIVVPSSTDREISIVLCMLVIVVLVVMLLLFRTGFVCLRATLPESLVLVQPQDVHLLPSAYDPITCSLLLEEGAAGGQTREGGRNSACEEGEEEAEEVESQGTGGAGYERRPGRPNGISSSGGSAPGAPPSRTVASRCPNPRAAATPL
ncbi:hypothetical protein ANANG_G00061820 [Anguilla anguilla]|uniref:Fibronectin type-III domain-containing protein n=1 Tax=Anguilla anguilla TaxID=7936 RepID=A0A9D3MP50_ANGAN|nr:hypothetical protein ANANG_G00061820 [Anguilla anguilla]